MSLSGKARLAGVLGWPVGHSRSPRLHGYWLEKYAIDGAYLPLPVRPEDFAEAFRALPKLGFSGVNVTIPHKQAALELSDEADPLARRIGSANTVLFRADGSSWATNTDGAGFLMNLEEQIPDWDRKGVVVLLGAGGGARSILASLLDLGVREVRLLNRTRDRAERVAAEIGGAVSVHDWGERSAVLAGSALLVNTTSLGMENQPPLDIDLGDLPVAAAVADIVYAPVKTGLLVSAADRGNPVATGPGMLLHQAVPGFDMWFARRPSVDDGLRRAVFPEIYGAP